MNGSLSRSQQQGEMLCIQFCAAHIPHCAAHIQCCTAHIQCCADHIQYGAAHNLCRAANIQYFVIEDKI